MDIGAPTRASLVGENVGAPRLHVFPSADPIFAAYAAEILRSSAARTPEDFETKLREMYPSATVRVRSPFAELMHQTATWYVYRDGHG